MNNFFESFGRVPAVQRWFLFGTLIVIFIVAFYFFMISPISDQIKSKQGQMASINQQLEELAEKKAKREELLKEIEELQSNLVRVQNQLPSSSQIPNLLQQIHDQARTAGLNIDRFERSADLPQEHYVEIPVKMNLSGTYDQLANFLFYVGRLTRIVNVRDISMSAVSTNFDKPNDLGQLKVSALATTFRYKGKNPNDTAANGGH